MSTHPVVAEVRKEDLAGADRDEKNFPCEGCGERGVEFFMGRWLCESCRFLALHDVEWELM